MESLPWLLLVLVIAGGLAAIIPLSRAYVALKANTVFSVEEIKDQLFVYREHLRSINLEYIQRHSTQDPEPYGPMAFLYQDALKFAHDRIFNSFEEHKTILHSIPTEEKNTIRYVAYAIPRIYRWNKAFKKIYKLQESIRQHEQHLEQVEKALKALDDLPVNTAELAKATRNLSWNTKQLLEELYHSESITGKTMEESIDSIETIEKSLNEVPTIFYTLSPEELISSPNIKSETQKVYRVIAPASLTVNSLKKKAETWKFTVKELRKTSKILQDKLEEADASIAFLNKSLILSGEQEELLTIHQRTSSVEANMAGLTIENLSITFKDAQQALREVTHLSQVFSDYVSKLNKLEQLISKITRQIEGADSTMKASAAMQNYPIIWTNSKSVLKEINTSFTRIPILSVKRTPAELNANLETAELCDSSLIRLLATVSKLKSDLEQLRTLWKQLRQMYTSKWFADVQALFTKVQLYDVERNWDQADRAQLLLADAQVLRKTFDDNIPSASSIPIYEHLIEHKLSTAKELVEKKPIFDNRKTRVQKRLTEVQKDEEKAVDIFKRVSPVVTQFAKDIRNLNLTIKSAQELLVAAQTQKNLEDSLQQRKYGRVSRKLDEIRKWEKISSESAVRVYKWLDDDLQKKREILTESLKSVREFVDDFEDQIVVRAHRYEVVYVKKQLDVSWIQKAPIEAIQKRSSKLIRTRKNVIKCQRELESFIIPVRTDYEKMIRTLNTLKATCSKLETDFERGWPPVFQSVRTVKIKIKNLEKDIEEIRELKWKKSELLKNYYSFRSRLRGIRGELEVIKEMDNKESLEINALEKEYKKLVKEQANMLYDGDEESISKFLNAANAHIRSLARKYKENKLTAAEIKANLERKVQSTKKQIININNSKFRDVSIRQKMN